VHGGVDVLGRGAQQAEAELQAAQRALGERGTKAGRRDHELRGPVDAAVLGTALSLALVLVGRRVDYHDGRAGSGGRFLVLRRAVVVIRRQGVRVRALRVAAGARGWGAAADFDVHGVRAHDAPTLVARTASRVVALLEVAGPTVPTQVPTQVLLNASAATYRADGVGDGGADIALE